MIRIDTERCNGCGECVEACPTGAVYLAGGKAMVEQALCRDCEVCIAACPMEAISFVTPKEAVVEPVRVPVPRPEPQVIQVKTRSASAPLRTSLLPAFGGALAWAWRELVPRLAEYLLYDLDRRAARRRMLAVRANARDSGSSVRGGGRGRRWRQRRRGG
jgi:NAD-dependent dihydropyrimidine dehydrogenase PreA subunit